MHARSADVTVPVPSYLDGAACLHAAEVAGADAIHPGYGFLAESAAFAEAVAGAGLDLDRSPPQLPCASAATSSKRSGSPPRPASRPCRRGVRPSSAIHCSSRPPPAEEDAGCGSSATPPIWTMRSRQPAARPGRRSATTRCSASATSNGLAMSRCSSSPTRPGARARAAGLLRAAPPPEGGRGVPPTRARSGTGLQLRERAATFAEAIGYRNAGTAEFLVDGADAYFLELNGRLQVEHPVTEALTGLDLVELQIRIAAGETLELGTVRERGHAVEARLYAEDPVTFLPQAGTISSLRLPTGVRVDAGVEEGDQIGLDYDPLIAKLIAHGATRDAALDRLADALAETRVGGVTTNLPFLRWLVDHPGSARRRSRRRF